MPLSTAIGQHWGWRTSFAVVAVLALLTIIAAALMAAFTSMVHHRATAVVGVFLLGMTCMTLMPSMQAPLLDVAPDASTLATSIMHSATNTANAIGAWAGGLVLSVGAGYAAIGWVGAALAVAGLVLACGSVVFARRPPVTESPRKEHSDVGR